MSKVSMKLSNKKLVAKSKRKHQGNDILKPFGFCCSIEKIDSFTQYDKLTMQYKTMPRHKIHESPTLTLRAQFSGSENQEPRMKPIRNRNMDVGDHRRKTYMRNISAFHNLKGTRFKETNSVRTAISEAESVPKDLYDDRVHRLLEGPLNWYLEDEIQAGKDILWKKNQEVYNEYIDVKKSMDKKEMNHTMKKQNDMYPTWYQDFSVEQMKNLKMLQCIMRKDCKQMVIGRTQRTLISIGIISTFVPLAPNVIKKLHKSTNCNVIQFLREIYKILSGNYFEEEGYRKFYDCNERIILSAIAFLTLPEAVVELQKRLPPVKMPKLRPKPTSPTLPIRLRMSSPYEEDLFVRPPRASYLNNLENWRERRKLLPIPQLILPPKDCVMSSFENMGTNVYNEENRGSKLQNIAPDNQLTKDNPQSQAKQRRTISIDKRQERSVSDNTKQKQTVPAKAEVKSQDNMMKNATTVQHTTNYTPRKQNKNSTIREKNDTENTEHEDLDEQDGADGEINIGEAVLKYDPQKSEKLDIPPLYGENTLFDFTINGICEKPGPVEYKLCGVLKPPQPKTKSWLDEKHAHYVITGASDEPPTCPVTYEITGIANVTPTNSNERFFAVLKLGEGPNKIYPSGRKNLSRHWQEWLQNVDEEFRKVEREANKMIKSIEAVTKLVFPKPTCDSCCSCRQTRKSNIKSKETKAPYFVIDTIAESENKQKYIVGSMAMHSPAPTPPGSTVNLLEVIASEDVLTTNLIINGITNEKGKTQYFISGAKEEIIRVPARVVERSPPSQLRNVPPCVCAIQQVFNKGLSPTVSNDNIPWTKKDGLCFGHKFRPQEYPAYSCKKYPGDKSCRRSPFMDEIIKLKRMAEKAKEKEQQREGTTEKKRMYSIADFQPCGDEHGMSICGGPWGALHTLTPEELAEQERVRKEILTGPPCGTKPGQAVCEGPFGERIRLKIQPTFIVEERPGEGDELDEEDEEVEEDEGEKREEPKPPPVKEKEKKHGRGCYMSPEAIIKRMKLTEKKVSKFIPDPNYPGYDDPWNVFRTAPSEKASETDFKTLLKLSSPKRPATPIQSKLLIEDGEKSSDESTPKSDSKKESSKRESSKKESQNKESAKKQTPSSEQSRPHLSARKAISEKFEDSKKADKEQVKWAEKKKAEHDEPRKVSYKSVSIKTETTDDKTKDAELSKPVKSERGPIMYEKPVSAKRSKKETQGSKRGEAIIDEKTSSRRVKNNKKSKKKLHNLMNNGRSLIDKSEGGTKGTKVLFNRKLSSPASAKKTKIHKVHKQSFAGKKPVKRDKKKDVNVVQEENPETIRKNKVQELNSMITSTDVYPYDVQPIDIPEGPSGKCKSAYEDIETGPDAVHTEDPTETQLPSKGPCGWRTKSEQNLPTKKTLAYLTDPDYPLETVPVRPGGKPCVCRENRAQKKILLYNIGGLIGGKKEDANAKLFKKKKEEDKEMQVIDGVIYYTPPPSPRRSDEYIPEYDLYDSPYDMCLTQCKDQNLKYLDRYSRAKMSEGPTNRESCGCNQYTDNKYGIETVPDDEEKAELMKELNKDREKLINEKSPKERWRLALNDVGLNDYFTRCRDSVPCWLKCVKFNKVGCDIPRRKLKAKRPVCECKYERKILEHNEEKSKWKERQKRLKSLKKQPYANITDISKPLVPNTKLMISGVKRIPRDDEYIDDIKYCITGVAEHYSHLPPKQIVAGVNMVTPIHTPEPSEHEIPRVCLHRHWSPTDITPGPLLKPEEIMLAERQRRQKAVTDAFRQIYTPKPVYHLHDDHGCKVECNLDSDTGFDKKIAERDQTVAPEENNSPSRLKKSMEVKGNLTNQSQQSKQQMKLNVNNPSTKTESKNVALEKTSEAKRRITQKETKESRDGNRLPSNHTKLNVENVDSSNKENKGNRGDGKKISLITTVKIELNKMATEGFIFAKLPKCFLMPQLRYWLMYRKGIALSSAEKHDLLRKSLILWYMLDVQSIGPHIEPPSLKMTQAQLNKLTYDDALKMKKKIAMKQTIFFSEFRKQRVLYGRTMWNALEYGMFPSVSFKQAYFTYMASKEADGHVFKPWMPA